MKTWPRRCRAPRGPSGRGCSTRAATCKSSCSTCSTGPRPISPTTSAPRRPIRPTTRPPSPPARHGARADEPSVHSVRPRSHGARRWRARRPRDRRAVRRRPRRARQARRDRRARRARARPPRTLRRRRPRCKVCCDVAPDRRPARRAGDRPVVARLGVVRPLPQPRHHRRHQRRRGRRPRPPPLGRPDVTAEGDFLEFPATSGDKPAIDGELQQLEKKLKKPPFSTWNQFKLLARSHKSLAKKKTEPISLKNGSATATLVEIVDKSKVRLTVIMEDAKGKQASR